MTLSSQGPSPKEQVEFLRNIQRILGEGSFVATYKYALLLVLADLSVENGDDSKSELKLTTIQMAEKFIEYYWRQSLPFAPRKKQAEGGGILRQNTDRQAAVINRLIHVRGRDFDTLSELRRDHKLWMSLVRRVRQIVEVMPLWKLQTVGKGNLDFLYPSRGKGSTITLRPGVAACFRAFHSMISGLVKGEWARYIRKYNDTIFGAKEERNDLYSFLFGSDRNPLTELLPSLFATQKSLCLYCEKKVTRAPHVDHFIPWVLYPVDLGHNFVLAHGSCNGRKKHHLAAALHLTKWVLRNKTYGDSLAEEFTRNRVSHNLPKSESIARWAYSQAASGHGQVWLKGTEFQSLASTWQSILAI